jgi:hypothetical protein
LPSRDLANPELLAVVRRRGVAPGNRYGLRGESLDKLNLAVFARVEGVRARTAAMLRRGAVVFLRRTRRTGWLDLPSACDPSAAPSCSHETMAAHGSARGFIALARSNSVVVLFTSNPLLSRVLADATIHEPHCGEWGGHQRPS